MFSLVYMHLLLNLHTHKYDDFNINKYSDHVETANRRSRDTVK